MIQGPGSVIVVDADDFQRTDRGVKWAIKFRDFGDYPVCYIVVQDPDGVWNYAASIDNGFDTTILNYKSVSEWVTKVLLVKLNEWLAVMFPATANPTPTPPPTPTPTPANQFLEAWKASKGIKIVVNANNTLTASI